MPAHFRIDFRGKGRGGHPRDVAKIICLARVGNFSPAHDKHFPSAIHMSYANGIVLAGHKLILFPRKEQAFSVLWKAAILHAIRTGVIAIEKGEEGSHETSAAIENVTALPHRADLIDDDILAIQYVLGPRESFLLERGKSAHGILLFALGACCGYEAKTKPCLFLGFEYLAFSVSAYVFEMEATPAILNPEKSADFRGVWRAIRRERYETPVPGPDDEVGRLEPWVDRNIVKLRQCDGFAADGPDMKGVWRWNLFQGRYPWVLLDKIRSRAWV